MVVSGRYIYILVVLLFNAVACLAQQNRFRLSWEDNFRGRHIDKSTWIKIPRSNGEWARYMSDNEAVFEQKNGRLRLFARRNEGYEPNDTARYLTGGISSRGKRTFRYGKIEVKARIRGCQGTWPAIWIMPNDNADWQYPRRAEIDIMECLNTDRKVYQTVHTKYTNVLNHTRDPLRQAVPVVRKPYRYHIYSVEILPDKLVFAVDGTTTLIYPRLAHLSADDGQFPFGVESYLMLDMQIDGAWVRTVDANALPAHMDIDWVRVYEYEGR